LEVLPKVNRKGDKLVATTQDMLDAANRSDNKKSLTFTFAMECKLSKKCQEPFV
jgi:hypothetical protein